MRINNWTKYTVVVFMLILLSTISVYASVVDISILKGNTALVTKKYTSCLKITSHNLNTPSDCLILTPTSSIYDIDGKKVKIKDLKLPCAAKIKYHKSDQELDAELIRMEIIEYAKKTSKKFMTDDSCLTLPE